MATVLQLQQLTADFFSRHWDHGSNLLTPEWSAPWSFAGPVPYNGHKGCYAFVNNGNIIYVGLALNAGVEGYAHQGIGKRVSTYWVVDPLRQSQDGVRFYRPIERLANAGVEAIMTLGFAQEQEYLAASLEYYLIQRLQPVLNQVHKQLR